MFRIDPAIDIPFDPTLQSCRLPISKHLRPLPVQQVPPTQNQNIPRRFCPPALGARLQDLIMAMIAVARPRTNTQFDQPAPSYEDGQPMWSILVRSDVTKQLAALEKIAREEETRIQQERKKRRHGRCSGCRRSNCRRRHEL